MFHRREIWFSPFIHNFPPCLWCYLLLSFLPILLYRRKEENCFVGFFSIYEIHDEHAKRRHRGIKNSIYIRKRLDSEVIFFYLKDKSRTDCVIFVWSFHSTWYDRQCQRGSYVDNKFSFCVVLEVVPGKSADTTVARRKKFVLAKYTDRCNLRYFVIQKSTRELFPSFFFVLLSKVKREIRSIFYPFFVCVFGISTNACSCIVDVGKSWVKW